MSFKNIYIDNIWRIEILKFLQIVGILLLFVFWHTSFIKIQIAKGSSANQATSFYLWILSIGVLLHAIWTSKMFSVRRAHKASFTGLYTFYALLTRIKILNHFLLNCCYLLYLLCFSFNLIKNCLNFCLKLTL